MGLKSEITLRTLHIVTAVPWTASRRLGQLVDVESTTATNANGRRSTTLVIGPMKTHFTLHNSLSHCRMSSSQITWRVRTTVIRCHNCISHLVASRPCEPIPGFGQRIVAFHNSFVTLCTVSLTESSVAFTFWEKQNAS